MSDEYNEDTALTDYVWFNYSRLMTGAEVWGHKAAASPNPELNASYARYFGKEAWAQMVEAYKDGRDVFRRRVRDRVLREHSQTVKINRCPNCNCILKTPQARQCLWCGADWHARP